MMLTAGKSGDSRQQAEFRQYCRDWLKLNIPSQPTVRLPLQALEIMTKPQLSYLCDWQKKAYDAGLIACDYPIEVGGKGMVDCQQVANEEMQAAKTPFFPNVIGLGMAAPTIYFHGLEEVQKSMLPKLFSGEEIWCQGFSEPGAGSDLASVQTFARKDGDRWHVSGCKVWTSLAHFASYMIALVRTDKSDKYGGLSYFILPIKAAIGNGVTVKPLIKITGETGFNEVIFDDLIVPDIYRLGGVGEGWNVAKTTLIHERATGPMVSPMAGGMSSESAKGAGSAEALIVLCKERFSSASLEGGVPVILDHVMSVIIRERAFQFGRMRSKVDNLCDDGPTRLLTQIKLVISEIHQDASEVALEVCGAASSLYLADPAASAGGQWALAYLNSFGGTIAAGTSEVQRNILGERILGLPKTK